MFSNKYVVVWTFLYKNIKHMWACFLLLKIFSFTTAPASGVTVNFTCEGNGFVLTNATLTLAQGQVSVPLTFPTVNPASFEAIRVSLNSPVHASLGTPVAVF